MSERSAAHYAPRDHVGVTSQASADGIGNPAARIPASGAVILFVGFVSAINWITYVSDHGAIFWGQSAPSTWSLAYWIVILTALVVASMFSTSIKKAIDLPWWAVPAIAFAAYSATAFLVIQRFLNSGDEYAYLFQAETFLKGRLWNSAPAVGPAVASMYTWVQDGKWVGQYPPAWPLVIASSRLASIPTWLINPLIAATCVAACWAIVGRTLVVGTRHLVPILFAIAPFTVFTAASLHSHVLAALLVLGGAFAADRAWKTGSTKWAVLTGLSVGALLATRYVSGVIVAIPIAVAFIFASARVRLCIGAILGGAPLVLGILYYHWRITGDPFKPVYWIAGRHVDKLYFDPESVTRGVLQTGTRLWDWGLWTSPVIPLLWASLLLLKMKRQSLSIIDAVMPVAVLVLVFYPQAGGNGYGPRYYFEFWPVACYTIATGVSLVRVDKYRQLLSNSLFLSCIYAALAWPLLAMDFSKIVQTRRDLYDQVAALNVSNAAVCVVSSTSKMLPLGVEDLPRNGTDLRKDVIYARCDLVSPRALQAAFPTRDVWIYRRSPRAEKGTLYRFDRAQTS